MQQCAPEEETSEAAAEGTAAHYVAAAALKQFEGFCMSREQNRETGKSRPDLRHWEGKTAPNSVIITEEMLEAVSVYVDRVLDLVEAAGASAGISYAMVEHPVECARIHPENKGTLDGGLFIDATQIDGVLIIVDFKYGWGLVEPGSNWQLLNYAFGVLEELYARGRPLPTTVELRIIQPRPWHPLGPERVWRVAVADMAPYHAKMCEAAENAFSTSPRTVTGPQCSHCRARHLCPALNTAVHAGADIVGEVLPMSMPPEALGRQIRLLKSVAEMAEARVSALEAQALGVIKSGGLVPGWCAQTATGRRRWSKPNEEVLALGDLLGVDLSKPALITPTQAIKAGLDESVVAAYSETPATGVKLVPDNLNSKAKQVFSHGK